MVKNLRARGYDVDVDLDAMSKASAYLTRQARIKRLWPELDQPYVPLATAREFTDTELGVDHVACPAEIREMFRWNL